MVLCRSADIRTIAMEKNEILEILREVPALKDAGEDALQWLLTTGKYEFYNEGDLIIRNGEPAEYLLIMLKGEVIIRLWQNGQSKDVITVKTGEITGLLPYSRMINSPADGFATQPTHILAVHKSKFPEMEREHPQLTQEFVSVMTSRVRRFTKIQQQDEKMAALGKLSAGLAHELNNPASAILRNAAALNKALERLPEKALTLATFDLKVGDIQQVENFLKDKLQQHSQLSLMERSEREDELTEWLSDKVEDQYCVAETFADIGVQKHELEELGKKVDPKVLPHLLDWLENAFTAKKLVTDIQEASTRIAELVNAVKSYSHMDRARDKAPVDVMEGIRNTLMILNHNIKGKNISVKEELAENIPKVPAYPGELNQVWTNLLDNAIDAVETGGTITIKASVDKQCLNISIKDNGSGIPEEIRSKIFDPFFTTKAIGEGTGLGLDLVKQIVDMHHGKINLQSKPGATEFIISLPLQDAV